MATVAFFGACARLVLFVYLGERAPDGQDGVGRHGARRAQIPHGAQPRDAVALKGGGVGARALVDEDDREPRERGALVYVRVSRGVNRSIELSKHVRRDPFGTYLERTHDARVQPVGGRSGRGGCGGCGRGHVCVLSVRRRF